MNTVSHMTARESTARAVAFVGRCAASATLAYQLAGWVGLSFPAWASISALVVSQERLHETRISLHDRLTGTLLGVLASVGVNAIGTPLGLSLASQLALSVAICAALARRWHNLRVCMWTCPAVLLTGDMSSEPVLLAGLYRSAEILLGCLIGAGFHLLAERMVTRVLAAPQR